MANESVKVGENVLATRSNVPNPHFTKQSNITGDIVSACSDKPSSSQSSSTSEEDEEPPPKRSRNNHVRSNSRDSSRDLDLRFEQLSQQLVSHLNNTFYNFAASSSMFNKVTESNNANLDDPFLNHAAVFNDIAQLDVSIQEPSIAKAIPERVTKLISMQRFNTSDWNCDRYIDIQKKYVAFPAFTDLKINEELRFLEDSSKFYLMERSFAALSNAFLAQNEFVNKALRSVLEWSSQTNVILNSNSIHDKLQECFGQTSDYKAVTHDVLQIICGKRAEVLESRRKSLLKNLQRKHIREDLGKIPPSSEYMFNPEQLSTYLQKVGGIDKIDRIRGYQPKTIRVKSPIRSKSPVASTSQVSQKPFLGNRYNSKQGQKSHIVNDHEKKKKRGRKYNKQNKYKHK
ncbi:unnamed protein product [Pieris macdunnoughi]|uniref:Uncharacterized protein n=1 Tax=Pieris macdunnoughi TaxID=345717 RepID=A0A821TGS1_9NEOP|nr:unnamed protein product [Pieris macdunnoughi]